MFGYQGGHRVIVTDGVQPYPEDRLSLIPRHKVSESDWSDDSLISSISSYCSAQEVAVAAETGCASPTWTLALGKPVNFKASAFKVTVMVLAAIARAAHSGRSSRPRLV